MKYNVPSADWLQKLADYIELAKDGDIIVVESDAAKELGERALKRMCPNKTITFEVSHDI
jgi:hypothetical protein